MGRGATKSTVAVAALLSSTLMVGNPTKALGMASEVIRTAPHLPAESQEPIELIVPLRERGPLGQVAILILPDGGLRVRSDDLLNLVRPLVTPEAIAALEGVSDQDGYITPEAARTVGYGLAFDPGLLDLALEIPFEARQTQNLAFGYGNERTPPTVTNRPEPFSIYANYRAGIDYLHRDFGIREQGFAPLRLDVDVGGNIGQVAYENFFTYDDDNGELTRNASRLIYDQVGNSIRWTLGDLVPQGTSLQSVPDIAGLSASRLYELSPNDRFLASRSSQTISLREPATVEIRINGVTARTISLPPGTYDLRDLPLTEGANAVELVIEGRTGQREVISFDFFSDSNLLGVGVDEFSVNLGVRAERDISGVVYEEDEPIFSGFYRRGLTNQITGGVNLQATRNSALFGTEATFGTVWGLTTAEAAFSENEAIGSGAALRVGHRYTRLLPDLGAETLFFTAETRTENFAQGEAFGPINNYSYQVAANYSRPINRKLTASLGANFAKGRGVLEDRYGVSARGNYRLDFDTLIDFGATYGNSAFIGEELNLFVNVSRRFGSRSSVGVSAETRDGRLSATYSRVPDRTLDAWALAGSVTRTEQDYGLDASAYYIANRGELDLNHTTAFDNDGNVVDQRSSARISGAVAYTGGKFAIGRRIVDSFAVVDTHPSLGGRDVLIRGALSQEETGRSGAFGPALVSIGSYFPQNVPYDVEDLPIGYDLGSGTFELLSRLHNGYVLTVGSDYFVTATGTLLNARAEPLALRSGRAVSLDDPDAPSPEVITNRVGRFAVSGLAAGRWRLTFQGSPALTYDIVVPADTLFRAGTLSPSGSGE